MHFDHHTSTLFFLKSLDAAGVNFCIHIVFRSLKVGITAVCLVFSILIRFKDKVEFCMAEGLPLLVENLGDAVPEVLDPILEKQLIKKGKRLYVTFMDQQAEYNPAFVLYMTTKLANPHFPPEINAKCTVIDFTVMHEGTFTEVIAALFPKVRGF